MEIATFDIIQVGKFWEKIFYMPPAQQLSMRFVTVGITDSLYANNTGSIPIVVLSIFLLFMFSSMLKKVNISKKY